MSVEDFARTRRGGKFFDKDIPDLVEALQRIAGSMTYAVTSTPSPTKDAEALDQIRALLDGKEWTPDTVDAISEIVRGTGRSIADFDVR